MTEDLTSTNLKDNTQYDHTLALIHIGIMLTEWDETLEYLPQSLIEVENRLLNVFGVQISSEPDIMQVRDKIVAITETTHDIPKH